MTRTRTLSTLLLSTAVLLSACTSQPSWSTR